MLRPFQLEELEKIKSFERDGSSPLQTTFGWLGSDRGIGGKMVTMARYLNEQVNPIRVDTRNWSVVTGINPVESTWGHPMSTLRTPVVVNPNVNHYPDLSYNANGTERIGTTLVVVSSDTSFEIERWWDALERWAPRCNAARVQTFRDFKLLLPAAERRDFVKSMLTSERCVDLLRSRDVHVLVVSASFLNNYRESLSHIMWTRIILNDGLTDDNIFKLFSNMDHTSFPTRFTWLIEALTDGEVSKLRSVDSLGSMTSRERFGRTNWLTHLCTSTVLPKLVVRTNDRTVQEQCQIRAQFAVVEFPVSSQTATPEYQHLVNESRILNAARWTHLSDSDIKTMENARCWSTIAKKIMGPYLLTSNEVEEFECSVCLEVDRSVLSCGHGLCRECLGRILLRDMRARCPLCRLNVDFCSLQRDLFDNDILIRDIHEKRVRAENDEMHMQMCASFIHRLQGTIDEILEEPSNHVLVLCTASLQYCRWIESNVPSIHLHFTAQYPPTVCERVFYASTQLYDGYGTFKRHPFELNTVTHIVVVEREPDGEFARLTAMLRVWSLGRARNELKYIFFRPG
jgi:hypothetical protein